MDLSAIRLVASTIPVFSATGAALGQFALNDVRWLIEQGRVGRITRRGTGTNGAIRRIDLLAMPGEMAHRTSQSTVISIGIQTWCPKDCAYLFGKRGHLAQVGA